MFIYKKSENDEEIFLNSLFKSLEKKTVFIDPVSEVNRLNSNPNLNHINNLLFFHWYERTTGENIINTNVLKGLNPSNKHESVRSLADDIIDRENDFMKSDKFPGFTVYFEYYHDFFPDLELLSFNDFCGRFFYDYLIQLFPSLHEVDFNSKKKFIRNQRTKVGVDFEQRFTLNYKSNHLPSFYPFIQGKLHTFTPKSLMSSEKHEIANLVRVEKGLPKIGEGWISETRLFYAIKEAFDFTIVLHHASPGWLGLQHFDIFIPEFSIAIEYQGIQHSKPIDFFGGEEAFIKNKERDERKKQLCALNNCTLIYAFPEDKHIEIIKKVKTNLLERGQKFETAKK